jgi:hypothetical protein
MFRFVFSGIPHERPRAWTFVVAFHVLQRIRWPKRLAVLALLSLSHWSYRIALKRPGTSVLTAETAGDGTTPSKPSPLHVVSSFPLQWNVPSRRVTTDYPTFRP